LEKVNILNSELQIKDDKINELYSAINNLEHLNIELKNSMEKLYSEINELNLKIASSKALKISRSLRSIDKGLKKKLVWKKNKA
jgi:uncharacterized protein YoxC